MRELKKQLLFSLATVSPEMVGLEADGTVPSVSSSFLTYPQLQWRVAEYEASSVRGAISGLKNEGAVTTLQREGKTRIRLTTVGRELLFSFIPSALFRRRRWDEAWRLAIFSGVTLDASTAKRYRVLRRILTRRGFAQLERGVYLSPYPLQESDIFLLSKHKALGLLTILETKRFVLGDELAWCNQAWNLDQISKEYTKLSAQCERAIALLEVEKGLNQRSKDQFRLYTKQLLQIMGDDPGLPHQLLPGGFGAQPGWRSYVQLSLQMLNRE